MPWRSMAANSHAVRTSNPAMPYSAESPPGARHRVAQTLLSRDSFSGWGSEPSPAAKRIQPISYHNGSIWPHDKQSSRLASPATVAKEAAQVFTAIFEAACHQELRACLNCFVASFASRTWADAYPVACAPQAWAAAAPFAFLGAVSAWTFAMKRFNPLPRSHHAGFSGLRGLSHLSLRDYASISNSIAMDQT